MAASGDELERVLVLAEWSESSDAQLLAAEVRRLSNIEEAMKSLADEKRKEAEEHRSYASDAYDHMDWESGSSAMVKYMSKAEQVAEIERALGLGG